MKKFMKMAILVASVLFAGSVFAQNPPTILCGDYRVAQGNSCGQPGAVVYNHAGYPTNARIGGGNLDWLANQANRIPIGGQIPQGYCSWDERLKNVGLSTLLGAVFGVAVTDNSRGAGQGAAGGLLVGTMIPCTAQQQYLEQRGNSQQTGEQYQGAKTVRKSASCIVGGEDFGDLPEATCQKFRTSRTVNEPAKIVFSNESTGAGTCRLLSDGAARLKGNPSLLQAHGSVLATSQATDSTAIVIPQNGNEDCSAWRRRVAPQILWMG